MRASVAARGITGSTFDQVAREAGVSRGLLHYYFGTKERLLVEVVRRECERALRAARPGDGRGEQRRRGARRRWCAALRTILGEGPAAVVMFYEMLTLAQRNQEIAAELAELRRTRFANGRCAASRGGPGCSSSAPTPTTWRAFLFALADGVTVRRLSEPELDIGP